MISGEYLPIFPSFSRLFCAFGNEIRFNRTNSITILGEIIKRYFLIAGERPAIKKMLDRFAGKNRGKGRGEPILDISLG
jgi:hypothetical protein